MIDRTDVDDEVDRRELPRDVADRAIARWNEATREQAEAYRLAGDRRELENWTDLTTVAAIAARHVLIRAILAYGPEYDGPKRHKAEKRRWSPRGLKSNGKLYLAFPVDDGDGEAEKLDGPDVMTLLVVDEANIVDVEGGGYVSPPAARSATVIGAGPPADVVGEAVR